MMYFSVYEQEDPSPAVTGALLRVLSPPADWRNLHAQNAKTKLCS